MAMDVADDAVFGNHMPCIEVEFDPEATPNSLGLKRMLSAISAAIAWLVVACAACAQTHSEPQPLPPPTPMEPPRDIAYPGALTLQVDATDIAHRIFRIRETIPVGAGPQVLLYPRWIPGAHSPINMLHLFAGLRITAAGRVLPWTRDTADVFAFHVDVPAGVTQLDIEAQFLSATDTLQGGISMTPEMLRLNWFTSALYPAGHFMRRIEIDASVRLPPGWDFGTALDVAERTGDTVKFRRVSFETLMDSPLIAGKHFRTFELDPHGRSRVTLNVAADEPEYLEVKPAVIEAHRELIRQVDKLYGARHFDHYDFLLTMTDRLARVGVEHQRSSDNGVRPKYFTTWESSFISRDLLAHEFNHSWNGKYRRPADLWTPTLNEPMRDSLLWVYEGQTQYYGHVLASRAGLLRKELALDDLASVAAAFDARVGRAWRSLQDTTNDPIITSRRPIPWPSYQRNEDYYSEGQLIWLEVDTLIRERSHGKRSLDDFARAFFGMNDGDRGQLTYTFDDVVAALNKIAPYDWATLFRTRLEANGTGAPLDGLKRGGYRLVYSETQSDLDQSNDALRKEINLLYSLGAIFDTKGKITQVLWGGPLFDAGLTTGIEVVAVNGVAFDADRLKNAVRASTDADAKLELLTKQGDSYRTFNVAYHGGLRYPHLERIPGTAALIDDIYAPRK